MKGLRICFGILFLIAFLVPTASSVQAITAVPYTPTVQAAAPLTVTGYAFDGRDVLYVQLFNKTDDIVNLEGWSVEYRSAESVEFSTLVPLAGMVKPLSYVLAASTDILAGADFPYVTAVAEEALPPNVILRLMPSSEFKPEEMKPLAGGTLSYWQRNISESTGNYLSTFSSFTPADDHSLFAGGLYTYPQSSELRIVEILANPRDCSPIDLSLDCRDYVKLFNPTESTIDLSYFRLRSGHQQQTATSSNTFNLEGLLEPGRYVSIVASEDGADVNLVNTGGYVWIEDFFGVKIYDTSVQHYPNSGSDSRKGHSWAYDGTTDKWDWSSQPTPEDAPNVFPLPAITSQSVESDERVPCNANQFRSAETGRCRLLAVASSDILGPCPPGEYRNESTNRCRSLAVTTGLTPCEPGEERNPSTNRCRKLPGEVESSLVPCKDNQERNPETNRCRNKTTLSSSQKVAFPVERTTEESSSFLGWWVLGAVVSVGVLYGIWEWHYELKNLIGRIFRRAG